MVSFQSFSVYVIFLFPGTFIFSSCYSLVRCDLPYDPVDNKCLAITPNFNGTAREARELCASIQGSLVIIDSEEQNRYLQDKVKGANRTRMLIGCTSRNNSRSWRCDDRIHPYMVHWTDVSSSGFWSKYWGVFIKSSNYLSRHNWMLLIDYSVLLPWIQT